LNAAARVITGSLVITLLYSLCIHKIGIYDTVEHFNYITGTRKFDSGQILHNDLHWSDVPQRVIFKLCMTVYKCLHGLAPKYIAELCVLVADVAGRRQLRSASRI